MENDTNTRQTVYYGNYVDENPCPPKDSDMGSDLKPNGKCQINIFCGGKKDKKDDQCQINIFCGGKDKKHNEENCQINIFCDHDALKKFNNKDDDKCHINILCGCNVD